MSLSPPEVIRESCRCSAINSMELNQKLKLKQRNATNATNQKLKLKLKPTKNELNLTLPVPSKKHPLCNVTQTRIEVHCRFREFFLSLKLFLPPSIELVGTRFL